MDLKVVPEAYCCCRHTQWILTGIFKKVMEHTQRCLQLFPIIRLLKYIIWSISPDNPVVWSGCRIRISYFHFLLSSQCTKQNRQTDNTDNINMGYIYIYMCNGGRHCALRQSVAFKKNQVIRCTICFKKVPLSLVTMQLSKSKTLKVHLAQCVITKGIVYTFFTRNLHAFSLS